MWYFRLIDEWRRPIKQISAQEAAQILTQDGISFYDWILLQEKQYFNLENAQEIIDKINRYGSYSSLDTLLSRKINQLLIQEGKSWTIEQAKQIIKFANQAQLNPDIFVEDLLAKISVYNPTLAIKQIQFLLSKLKLNATNLHNLYGKQLKATYLLGNWELVRTSLQSVLSNTTLDK